MVELITTRHARFAMERRGLSRRDVRSVVYGPDRVEDGRRPRTERRFRKVSGRTVVAVVALERRHLRLLTAYFFGEDDPTDFSAD